MIVTTSWDDGDILDIKLLELMDKYGIKGTFYIPGNTKLSKKQINMISKTQEIGAHTMNHVELNNVSLDCAKHEIFDSKVFLEKIINKNVECFCYPRGKYNSKIIKIVKDAKFKYARTVDRFVFNVSKDPFLNGTSCQTLKFRLDAIKFLKLNSFNIFSLRYIFDWQYFARQMFRYAKKIDGIFHLWGHSWEIDKYDQWDDIEKFFKYLSKQDVKFCTNGDLI